MTTVNNKLKILPLAMMAVLFLASCETSENGTSREGSNQNHQSNDAPQLPKAVDLTLDWQHEKNINGPENAASSYEYVVNSGNLARLVLTNKSSTPLPANGWAIYFSAGSFMARDNAWDEKAFRKSNPSLKLSFTGIAGRYKIGPGSKFKPLKPGASLTISYRGSRFLMLASDRPAGFYLVGVNADGQEKVHGDLPIAYGPIHGFKPAPQPLGARMNAAARYARYAENHADSEAQLVLPLPKKVEIKNDKRLELAKLGAVKYSPDLNAEGSLLSKLLAAHRRPTASDDAPQVTLSVDSNLGREHYRLNVDADGVRITGGSAAGVFYGIQTFAQIIDRYQKNIPHLTIEDGPQFTYRGLMIDISRHFFGKETLKTIIDQMAHYKLNVLQLHLNDDEGWRIEIDGLPELTAIGSRRGHHVKGADGKVQMLPLLLNDGSQGDAGFLSRADYIEILKYAKQRHIEVIPEIDVPGHSRAAILALGDKPGYKLVDPFDKSKHVSPQGFTDNILNPAMGGVTPFLEKVFGALNEMHEAAGVPLARVHMGGDEAPHEAWTLSPACAAKGYENVDPKKDKKKADAVHEEIRMDFSQKLYSIIDKACSKPIRIGSWHDNAPYIGKRLADGKAYVTDWDLDGEAGYARIRAGQPTVLCNPRFTYLDMAYEIHPSERGHFWAGFTDTKKIYEYRPFGLTDPPLNSSEQANVMGMQAQVWTETVTSPDMLQSYLMPRLLAFVERAWNPDVSEADVKKNWPGFTAYVGAVALPKLERDGFNFRVPKPGAIEEPAGQLKTIVPFAGLDIRYTTDGSDPDLTSPVYSNTQPVPFSRKIKLRAFAKSGKSSATVALDVD